jgi:hypothetical protein
MSSPNSHLAADDYVTTSTLDQDPFTDDVRTLTITFTKNNYGSVHERLRIREEV